MSQRPTDRKTRENLSPTSWSKRLCMEAGNLRSTGSSLTRFLAQRLSDALTCFFRKNRSTAVLLIYLMSPRACRQGPKYRPLTIGHQACLHMMLTLRVSIIMKRVKECFLRLRLISVIPNPHLKGLTNLFMRHHLYIPWTDSRQRFANTLSRNFWTT